VSIQKDSYGYRVRWREGDRQRQRTFERKRDAEAFEIDVKRRRQLGALAPGVLQSRMTLAQFVEEDWWPRHAAPNLKPSTKDRYLEIWGTHLLPRVGAYELRQITPLLVEDFRDQLERRGVGGATRRKALMLLQGILKRAVVRGLLPSNPVQVVDKPRQPMTRRPEPLSPDLVEQIRTCMLTAWSSPGRGAGRATDQLAWWRRRNATLVSMLAYAGLRPEEATGVRWRDLEDRALHVYAGKTERARVVRLLTPLSQDLAEWRLASGRPSPEALVFPTYDADDWTRQDWANWRRRVYQPAARAAGVEGDMRVYRLRGSFVSLLLWEGRSLTYVAEQAGHSIATLARHYAGVLDTLEDLPRLPAAEAIRQARESLKCARSVREAGTAESSYGPPGP
jgi:integrase